MLSLSKIQHNFSWRRIVSKEEHGWMYLGGSFYGQCFQNCHNCHNSMQRNFWKTLVMICKYDEFPNKAEAAAGGVFCK